MNLYFRLFLLLLKLPFLKKVKSPLDETTMTVHVWPNDLDYNFHMNNGRYLTIMDLGRTHYLAKSGLMKAVLKRKWLPILGSAKIHFIRPLNCFNKIHLKTRLAYWDEKWIYMEQHFYHKNQLMATAIIKALFVCKGQKISPDELLKIVPNPPQRPAPAEKLVKWIEAEKAARDS